MYKQRAPTCIQTVFLLVVYCKNVFHLPSILSVFVKMSSFLQSDGSRPVFSSQRSARAVSLLNKLIFYKDYKRLGQPFQDIPQPAITCTDHPQLPCYLETSFIKLRHNKTQPILIKTNPMALSRLITYSKKYFLFLVSNLFFFNQHIQWLN